jgi:6-pyruvoyltetrahydropterin/6-carboxytetrahydropterin synthase
VIRLSRKIEFNASRKLWRSDWTEEKNRSVYGEESPHGYGHNYVLEVEVEGEIDPEKAMVVNLTDLDRILKEEVDRPLDHRNLNLDVPEFRETVPTFENLARWIWDRIARRLDREKWPCRLSRMKLSPGPDLAIEIEA